MPDVTIKLPDQPGSSAGSVPDAVSEPDLPTKQAESSETVKAASVTGASVQAILAMYESLDRAARGVAHQISRTVSGFTPTPKWVLITGGETDLSGLAEYRSYLRSLEHCAAVQQRLRARLEGRPESARAAMSPALDAAIGTVGTLISDVIKPLVPAFTFSDATVPIENPAFVMLVAGAAVAAGPPAVPIFTPFSISLRQADPLLLEPVEKALSGLDTEAGNLALLIAQRPESERPPFEAALKGITDTIDALETALRDRPEIARGAALQEAVAEGITVHVTVLAAGTQVHERSFLLGKSRRHLGGVAAAFSIYKSDGSLLRGGFVRPTIEHR